MPLHALFRSTRFAATTVALAALVACTNDDTGTVPHQALLPAERAAPAHPALVYVSDGNDNLVAVFNDAGKRVSTINAEGGLNDPQNLFVDASGNLWVANEGGHDVLEYPPESPYPTAALLDGKNLPVDVTMCPNGEAFVANVFSPKHGGDITVYDPGARRASRVLTYEAGEFTGITCDANGNVFATAVVGTSGSVVAFPHGQQSRAKQLPIFSAGNLGGIKIDAAGNLLVVVSGQVTEYTEDGRPTGVTIPAGGWNGIALNAAGTTLYGADAGSEQGVGVSFPGGIQQHTYRSRQFKAVIGIAWGPAS